MLLLLLSGVFDEKVPADVVVDVVVVLLGVVLVVAGAVCSGCCCCLLLLSLFFALSEAAETGTSTSGSRTERIAARPVTGRCHSTRSSTGG